jgi:YVTN family beta-propeller protein
VRVLDGQGNALLGTTALPVHGVDGASVYDEPYSCMDIMDGGTGYGEYSAYALNRIAGQRARCGNYNSPCNIGEFLDEIPPHNTLEVRWPSGQPVPSASVEVYRARPFPGVWYARQYVSVPDLQLVADGHGQVDLGASPFSESGDIIHTWGHSNALLLLKITTQAGIEVHFLDVTAFNLAYWKGIETPIYPVTLTHSMVSAFSSSSLSSFPQHISSADGELPFTAQGNMSLNGNLLIAQATTNAVSIIDVETGDLVHESITVGQFPNWLNATSDRVFVVNGQSDSVSILDRSTYDVLDTISVGDDPRCMVTTRGEQYGYVTNNGSKSISVINLQTGTTTNTLLLNAHPEAAIASPDGAYVYVAANTPGKVASINGNTNQISDWFHIGRQPQAIALSPNGQYLYVVDFSGHILYTVDAITAQIVDVMALPGLPQRIVINPDGSKAYVANYSLNQLYVVNLANHRVIETINVQSSQWGMGISQDGRYLFVSLYDSKETAVIDTTSNTVVRRFVTNGNPTAVYFDQQVFNVYLPLVVRQYTR